VLHLLKPWIALRDREQPTIQLANPGRATH